MIIDSLRFGQLEVPEDKIIHMERPILGFENLKRYCLVELDDLAPFLWFQSTEEAAIAFLVLNPVIFFPDYRIEINSMEIAELKVSDVTAVETYVIVSIEKNSQETTANLQGPILINTENNRAKQLVLVNSEYRVRHSLLEAAKDHQPEAGQRSDTGKQPVAGRPSKTAREKELVGV